MVNLFATPTLPFTSDSLNIFFTFPDGAAGRRKLGIKTNTISSSKPQLNRPPTQRLMISVKVSIIIVRSHDHNFRHAHYDVREVNVPPGCDYSSSVAVRGMQAYRSKNQISICIGNRMGPSEIKD